MTIPSSMLVAAGLFFHQGSLVKDLLAAAGGALLGGLVTAFVLVLMFKAVRVKKVPRRTTVGLSVVGGLVAGWLVWQGMAGGGLGPGPGGGTGSGKGIPISTSFDTGPASTRREPSDTLRVVIVRSVDYEKDSRKYYLIDGRPPPRNLEETIQVIADRKKLNPALSTLEVVVYLDSITEERKLGQALKEPAEKEGLTWKLLQPDSRAP